MLGHLHVSRNGDHIRVRPSTSVENSSHWLAYVHGLMPPWAAARRLISGATNCRVACAHTAVPYPMHLCNHVAGIALYVAVGRHGLGNSLSQWQAVAPVMAPCLSLSLAPIAAPSSLSLPSRIYMPLVWASLPAPLLAPPSCSCGLIGRALAVPRCLCGVRPWTWLSCPRPLR